MIRLLDKETIDRIAAGEVVENPRSVVKELVENSFDAGAHRVTIQIRDGGRSLIRVSDDGCGIEAGEVLTAFERHATSKIKNSDDLSFISTMGFRGEALSSIAAVSRTELVTKCEKDLTGVRVTADGGQISEPEEIGAPGGTTVIVRDLFFNVPARRKFLKTARSEANQVYDTVVKLALSRPDVSVSYIQDNRAVFQTGGNNNLKEAAYRIFGKEVTKSLIPVEFGDDELGVRVKGYLGAPSENRSNREMEYFFINGRTVLSKVFSKALEEGGTGFFMQHRFPVCFLHFTIDTDRVDVNVHPSKLTVRLPDEPEIYNFICDRVAEAYKAEERVPDRDPESRDRGPGADIREASALPGMVRDKNEENESSAPKTVERGTLFDEEKDESKGAESFDGDRQEDQDESKGAELFDDDKAGNSGNELFDDEKAGNSGGELFGDEKAGNSGGELFDDEKEDHNSVNKDEEHFADDNGNRNFDDRKYINKGSDPGEDTINGAGGRSYNDPDNMEVSSPDGNTYNGSGSSPDTENGEDGRKASPAPELNDFKETTGEQESMDFGNDPGNKDPRILSGEGRPSMRLIGQAFGTYWFIEFGKRLLVMDQHAAHEKVKFERIRSQIMSGEVFTQMINPPFTVNLTPGQSEILETYQEDLEKLGFETDSLGGGTYALRSVPIELFGCDPGDLLSEILDDLKNKGSATRESSSVRLRIATMACKAAVKGNTVLPFEKAEALLNELVTLEEPYHCPHGRPTIIEIKESELDKRFKRIQD